MNGPNTFDCAGLIWFLYNTTCNINLYKGGFGLSTTTKIMTSYYGKLILFKESDQNKDINIIKKGDIIFFHRQSLNDDVPKIDNKYPGHCGLYIDDNYFIHCSSTKGKVVISNFENNAYWKNVLVASKDVLSDEKVLKKVIK